MEVHALGAADATATLLPRAAAGGLLGALRARPARETCDGIVLEDVGEMLLRQPLCEVLDLIAELQEPGDGAARAAGAGEDAVPEDSSRVSPGGGNCFARSGPLVLRVSAAEVGARAVATLAALACVVVRVESCLAAGGGGNAWSGELHVTEVAGARMRTYRQAFRAQRSGGGIAGFTLALQPAVEAGHGGAQPTPTPPAKSPGEAQQAHRAGEASAGGVSLQPRGGLRAVPPRGSAPGAGGLHTAPLEASSEEDEPGGHRWRAAGGADEDLDEDLDEI